MKTFQKKVLYMYLNTHVNKIYEASYKHQETYNFSAELQLSSNTTFHYKKHNKVTKFIQFT
jgi:hypothetical protein